MSQFHLNEIHQSSAALNQYCKWNGTHWVPATGTVASPYSEDTMGDADKVWTAGMSTMRVTAAFTAARTLTLPAANSLVAGSVIFFNAPFGFITATNFLNINADGSDSMNNLASFPFQPNANINYQTPHFLFFITDGVSAWQLKGIDEYISLLNKVRPYTPETLAVNTNRQPNPFNDVQVIITFNLACDDGETATATVLVDNQGSAPFQTIATAENVFNVTGIGIGGALTIKQVITFICPANSNYKWVAAGSGSCTVTDIYELTL